MKWADEFRDFVDSEGVRPSGALTEKILAQAKLILNPSPYKVFSKLSLIHALVGSATLLVCPQFGIQLAGKGMGLMHLFMGWGDYGCMIGCGSLFTGGSALLAGFLLKPEEVQVIRRNRLVQLLTLALLSMGALVCFGGEFIGSLAATWLLGSTLTAAGMIELTWLVRLRARA